ncbi:MAG: cell division protein FtsA [Candidatus Cloacimonadota bacterium]|nr:cell division protein FtsA [Candidatus Cloacimonadota bacterium]
MKAGQVFTAIDIGTTKICTIIAVVNEEEKLEVKGIGKSKTKGMENGLVIDISLAAKSIADAIKEAEEMSEMKAKNIFVGIAGEHIHSFNTLGRVGLAEEPGEITAEHVSQVIKDAKTTIKRKPNTSKLDIIHAIPQYFEVDGQKGIMNPINMNGDNLSAYVHIVMADINTMANIRKCLEVNNYKIKDIFLEPIASAHAVLNEVEKKLGSILIDIGGGTTDIVVFYKGSIRFSAVLPQGGEKITQDLSIGLKTSPQIAEQIKIEKGNAIAFEKNKKELIEIEGIGGRPSRKKSQYYISKIIEERMKEILEKAYNLLNENHNLSLISAGLTISGGASQLKNAEILAEKIFNQSTKIGYPDLTRLAGPTDRLNNPMYATTVGILYHAYDQIKNAHSQIWQTRQRDPIWKIFKKILSYFS